MQDVPENKMQEVSEDKERIAGLIRQLVEEEKDYDALEARALDLEDEAARLRETLDAARKLCDEQAMEEAKIIYMHCCDHDRTEYYDVHSFCRLCATVITKAERAAYLTDPDPEQQEKAK